MGLISGLVNQDNHGGHPFLIHNFNEHFEEHRKSDEPD